MTLFSGGSVSISAGGEVCCAAVDTSTVGVGDVNPGNGGVPAQDVRIRLIKMRQFRVRKRRFFIVAIEFFIIPIHYTRVKIKKDTDVAVSF